MQCTNFNLNPPIAHKAAAMENRKSKKVNYFNRARSTCSIQCTVLGWSSTGLRRSNKLELRTIITMMSPNWSFQSIYPANFHHSPLFGRPLIECVQTENGFESSIRGFSIKVFDSAEFNGRLHVSQACPVWCALSPLPKESASNQLV